MGDSAPVNGAKEEMRGRSQELGCLFLRGLYSSSLLGWFFLLKADIVRGTWALREEA